MNGADQEFQMSPATKSVWTDQIRLYRAARPGTIPLTRDLWPLAAELLKCLRHRLSRPMALPRRTLVQPGLWHARRILRESRLRFFYAHPYRVEEFQNSAESRLQHGQRLWLDSADETTSMVIGEISS